MANRVRFNVFDLSRQRTVALVSSIFLFGFGIWFLNNILPYKDVWEGFYTEKSIGTFFCEKTDMSAIVRQPFNTFSNFIYWISGFAIVRRGWKDQQKRNRYNIISANPFYSIVFGGILIYTFVASTFFHASLIHFAKRLDFSAVYSLSLFPLMYFTHRVWLLSIGHPSNTKHSLSTRTLVIAFTLIYLALTLFVPDKMADYLVLAIILTTITFAVIVEMKDRGKTNHRYLGIAVCCILIAVMCFDFDVHKVFCHPDSAVQPHSLWHLFSGISSFYFYMYIRSERHKI